MNPRAIQHTTLRTQEDYIRTLLAVSQTLNEPRLMVSVDVFDPRRLVREIHIEFHSQSLWIQWHLPNKNPSLRPTLCKCGMPLNKGFCIDHGPVDPRAFGKQIVKANLDVRCGQDGEPLRAGKDSKAIQLPPRPEVFNPRGFRDPFIRDKIHRGNLCENLDGDATPHDGSKIDDPLHSGDFDGLDVAEAATGFYGKSKTPDAFDIAKAILEWISDATPGGRERRLTIAAQEIGLQLPGDSLHEDGVHASAVSRLRREFRAHLIRQLGRKPDVKQADCEAVEAA